MKKYSALLTFAMLAAVVLVLLKVAIYTTNSIHYKVNPIYTFGTFGVLFVSVLQLFNNHYKQGNSRRFWVLVPDAILLVIISTGLSFLVDQIAFYFNPNFVQTIKDLSIAKLSESSTILNSKLLNKNIELLKQAPNSQWMGIVAYFRDLANAILINSFWILPFTLIYRFVKNKQA